MSVLTVDIYLAALPLPPLRIAVKNLTLREFVLSCNDTSHRLVCFKHHIFRSLRPWIPFLVLYIIQKVKWRLISSFHLVWKAQHCVVGAKNSLCDHYSLHVYGMIIAFSQNEFLKGLTFYSIFVNFKRAHLSFKQWMQPVLKTLLHSTF